MSETIAEMILPGTYIDVRAAGLIGVDVVARMAEAATVFEAEDPWR